MQHITRRAFSTGYVPPEPSFLMKYGMTILSTGFGFYAMNKGKFLYDEFKDISTWPVEHIEIVESNLRYKNDSILLTSGWMLEAKLRRTLENGDSVDVKYHTRLSRDMIATTEPTEAPSNVTAIISANPVGEKIPARVSPTPLSENVYPEFNGMPSSPLAQKKAEAFKFMGLGVAAFGSAVMRETMKIIMVKFAPK